MANLSTKIAKYLEANSKNARTEFDNETVVLEDTGSGATLITWNVSGVAEPTDEQIASYETVANTAEKNVPIIQKRKIEYGSIGDQLDLLYKDMLADKGDKTGEWFKKIKAVKDANAKE